MKKLIIILSSVLCSIALIVTGVSPVSAADTISAAPKAAEKFSTGFTLKWASMKNAHHYQVKYSSDKNFKTSSTVERYNSRWLGDLTQNKTYYIKYRAVYKNKTTYSSWSKVGKMTTNARFPGKFSTIYTKKKNGVTLNWSKSEFAQKYRVMIGDNKGMNVNVKNYYTTKRTYDIKMNSKDGQPKYIRVFSYNNNFMRYSNERMLIKPSSLSSGKGESITIATQNMLCVTCSPDKKPAPKWNTRAPLLLNDVKKHNPDIYLMQEAGNTKNGEKIGQQTEFYNSLKKYGYSFNKNIEKDGTTGDKNRIAFKNSKYTFIKNGRFSLSDKNRSAVWVLLKSKKTKKQFYVVSTHISPYIAVKSRIKDSTKINTEMDKINSKKYPIFLGGDMNSNPNGPQGNTNANYVSKGWTDSAGAKKETNAKYGTYNKLGKNIMTDSFGRIDYLYSKNTGGWISHKNVITVDSKGKITSRHGSDHNLIIGSTTIG